MNNLHLPLKPDNRRRKHRLGDASSVSFTTRFLRRSRQLYRRYLDGKPWVRQFYTEFLGVKPGLRIVDVGCGTGDFTRYLAELAGGNCEIIGVDSRAVSVKAATRETSRLKPDHRISFRQGDAYTLPIEDGYSDLTCCRTLLMHLKEPDRAVREMARVTSAGGKVAALERGRMNSFYDPSDEYYSELSARISRYYATGLQRLEGKDFVIGDRLPSLFHEAGLEKVSAEVQADTWIPCDYRRKLRDVKNMLRFEYDNFQKSRNTSRKILIAGGAPREMLREYFGRYERRVKRFLSSDEALTKSGEFYVAGFYIVTGIKSDG